MINIFFDTETTGINPYYAEIISAFFYIDDNIFYEYKARPLEWSDDAEKIHKISYAQAMLYPDKKEALADLIWWLKQFKDFRFLTYTNKNTELGVINFDYAILANELDLNGFPFYTLEKIGMNKPLSVYETAKWGANMGYFTPIRGKSGRQSFSQENVYKALFNEEYNAHDAKQDVLALVRIYNELLRLKNENKFGLFGSNTNNS